ncbi:MAG: type II secretion system F family protein [Acidimicrobiia bacterium]
MSTTYAYRVRDREGRIVEGQLEADSVPLVATKLRSMGYTPINIESKDTAALQRELKLPGANRVKLKDVAVMSRQLATMINSGLPLLRALTILAEQTENKELARTVNAVRLDVERGASFSQALQKHPKAFNKLYVSMVRSGETSGTLESVLNRLSETLERQLELRRRVRSAMAYPVIVALLVSFITAAMLLFIVPQFETMYRDLGGQLPLPTRMLLAVSNVFRSSFLIIIALGIAGGFGFRKWIATEKGRAAWDAIKLRVPVFGALIRKTALARFSRTLAALTRSGVPILESLDIVAETSGNSVIAKAVRATQRAVKTGEPIAKPLEQHEVFPPMVVQMMAVGEETGALDEMLDKVADFYDQEVAATVDALTSLIEPLLIVVMGGIVGTMIICLYLPMFQIINLIK